MAKKLKDLATGDTIYVYNKRQIKKQKITDIKRVSSGDFLDLKFEEKSDFSTIKLSDAENDYLYFLIDGYFLTTDRKILLRETKKIYEEELKRARIILTEWLLEKIRQKRF